MEILLLLVLIFLHGFLVLGESALVSVKRTRLEGELNKGRRNTSTVLRLLDNLEQTLSALRVGTFLLAVAVGVYGGTTLGSALAPYFRKISSLAPWSAHLSIAVFILLLVLFMLILGQRLPKFIAFQIPEKLAIRLAPAISLFVGVFSPLSDMCNWVAQLLMRIFFIRPRQKENVSEEEIKQLVDIADEQGVLDSKESEIIHNILRFADRDAYNLMTHRNDVIWLDLNAPQKETDKLCLESGYTKFLVCEESIDQIVGVVKLKDYITQRNQKGFELKGILTEPLYVPETMNSLKVLERFRTDRNYFAVVVDEYGALQGILTLHDLTENIFGALPDLDDLEQPAIILREDGSWLVDGTIPVDELSETIELEELSADNAEYTTLAGYIMFKRSEIPREGEVFHIDGFRFEIVDMDMSKIDKVLISSLM